jgi:hypothetical protein
VTDAVRYETIGADYATTRREDPVLRARIHAALGDARTVVNVAPAPARTSRATGTSSRSSPAT